MRTRRLIATAMLALLVLVQPAGATAAEAPPVVPGALAVQVAAPEGYETPAGFAESSLEGLYVEIWNDEAYYYTQTDASGVVVFEDVEPGSYHLWVGSPREGALLGGGWTAAGTLDWDSAGEPVEVGAAGVSLVAELRPAGVLRGTVVGPDGEAVPGAMVHGDTGTSVSDAAGAFAVALGPGAQKLWVEAPSTSAGLSGYWVADHQVAVTDWEAATAIVTSEEGVVTPSSITVQLAAGATVTGTIVDSDGSPVEGTEVHIGARQATTGADGTYAVRGIEPGGYEIAVVPGDDYSVRGQILIDGTVGSWDDGEPLWLEIIGTETVSGIDGSLRLGGAISGDVTGLPDGTWVWVGATSEMGSSSAEAEGSSFVLRGLAPGDWRLRYSIDEASGLVIAPVTVTVAAGETTVVSSTAVEGGRITGSVVGSDGLPASDAEVRVVSDTGSTRYVHTDQSGSFEAAGLVAGTYAIEVSADSGFGSVDGVEVAVGATTDVGEISLDPPAWLEITVTDHAGDPIEEAWIDLWAEETSWTGTASTDAEGRVSIAVPGAGWYWYSVYAGDFGDAYGSVEVTESGSITPLAVELHAYTSLDLHVTSSGEDLADREIGLRSTNGSTRSTTTDEFGNAWFGNIEPGEYVVVVPGTWSEWDTWNDANPVSDPITVTAGANSASVDFDLRYRITVQALGMDGLPAPSAQISLTPDHSGYGPYGVTGDDGAVTFDGITAGAYVVGGWVDGQWIEYNGGTPVVIDDASPTAEVVLAPDSAAWVLIEGTITDELGQAVVGESIEVQTSVGEYEMADVSYGGATTDENGEYRVLMPRGEAWRVVAAYANSSTYAPAIAEGDLPETGGVVADLTVVEGATLSGSVRGGTPADPSGATDWVPVEGATVSIWVADGVRRTAVTDANGDYTLVGLPDELPYQIHVYATGLYTSAGSMPVEGAVATMRLIGGVSFAAALEEGEGWVTFTVFDDENLYEWQSERWSDGETVSTTMAIDPGTYRTQVSAAGHGAVNRTVTVEAGTVTELAPVVLERRGDVTGTLTIDGVPLRGAGVYAYLDGTFQAQAWTDADGSYALSSVGPGDVELQVRWNGEVIGSDSVTVAAGDDEAVNIDLPLAAVGTLVRLEILGEDDGMGIYEGQVTASTGRSMWSGDGVMQFVGLPAGEVSFYMSDDYRYIDGWIAPDGSVSMGEVSLTISSDAPTWLAVTPATYGTVSGFVTAAGVPLADAYLRASVDGSYVRGTWTEADGRYALPQLPPGEVTVEVLWQGETVLTETVEVANGVFAEQDFEVGIETVGSVVRFDVTGAHDSDDRHWGSILASSGERAWINNGAAIFVGLPEGPVTFRIEGDERYLDGWISPDGTVGSSEASFDIVTGVTAVALDVEVTERASIAGVVTAGGVPLTGARVSATRDGVSQGTVLTDRNGRYDLGLVDSGEVTVTSTWNGHEIAATTLRLGAGEQAEVPLAAETSVIRNVLRVSIQGSDDSLAAFSGYVSTSSGVGYRASNGFVQLVNLAPGSTTLELHGDDSYGDGWIGSDGTVGRDAEVFAVVDGATYRELDVTAAAAVTVTGIVTDPEGLPLADVEVSAGRQTTWTDASGFYALTGLGHGDTTVTVISPDRRLLDASSVVAGAPGDTVQADFALERHGVVDVTVTDIDGTPVADARVWAYGAHEAWVESAITDQNGVATVEGLPDTPMVIEVAGPGASDIDAYIGQDALGAPAEFQVGTGERLAVGHTLMRVADLAVALELADAPESDELVELRLLDAATGAVLDTSGWSTAVTAGTLHLFDVAPGDYVVQVTGTYYDDVYVGSDGQASSSAGVAALHVRGDGSDVTLEATLARTWVDSVTVLRDLPAEIEYASPEWAAVDIDVPSGSKHANLGVEIRVDDVAIETFAIGGSASWGFWLPELTVGEHTVTVDVTGSGAVRGSHAAQTFAVVPAAVTLTVRPEAPIRWAEDAVVELEATYADGRAVEGGVVDLTVGDVTLEVALTGTATTVEVPNTLDVGSHGIVASLRATDVTRPAEATSTLAVERWASTVTVSADHAELAYGGTFTVTPTVVAGGGVTDGQVTVSLAGEQLAVGAPGEPLAIAAATLGAGTHVLDVAYSGSATVAPAATTVTLTVIGIPTETTLTLPGAAVTYGEDISVSVSVSGSSGDAPQGTVTVMLGGTSRSAAVEDGAAQLTFPAGMGAGEHDAVATFAPVDPWLASSSATDTVEIAAASAVVEAAWPSAGAFGRASSFTVEVATAGGYPASGTVRALLDGVEVASASLAGGARTLTLPSDLTVGDRQLEVVYDGTSDILAGSSGEHAWTVGVGAPALDVEIGPDLVPLSDSTPPATVRIEAAAGGAPMTYRVWFGDGTPAISGTYEEPLEIEHTYAASGSYGIRVEVTASSGGSTATTVRTGRVTAFVDQPLAAVAGDAQRTVTGESVWFDASASRPAVAIDTVTWDFGDGTTGTGWQVSHAYAEPGDYAVTLTVARGEDTATATTSVNVAAVSLSGGVDITVTTGGALLGGAQVIYTAPDGSKSTVSTGADGTATLWGVPDGEASIAVWADGYSPKTVVVEVADGAGRAEVAMVPGEVGSTVLEHRRMTLEEIVDAGIDVQDPDNTNVYEANIMLHFVEPPTPDEDPEYEPVTYTLVYSTGSSDGGGAYLYDVRCEGTCGGGTGWLGGATPRVEVVEGHPVIEWLVIPMRASWLKEMFEVQLVVTNLAPEEFVFTGGRAELSLPNGLGLATMVGAQQTLAQTMADIPGGQSGTATWYVRGDVEGEYTISARYDGTVDPVDVPLSMTATAAEPIKVWGASALDTVITVDPDALRGAPYRVTLDVTNVTDGAVDAATIHNLALELLERPADAPDTWALYQWAPLQQTSSFTAELAPGETATVDAILYPYIGNEDVPFMLLDLESSVVSKTGGNVDLEPTLVARDSSGLRGAMTAELVKTTASDRLDLAWDAIDGAESYLLYTRDSLRTTSEEWRLLETFDSATLSTALSSDDAGLGRYFTVVTVVDGEPVPAHPLVEGAPTYAVLGDSFSSGEGVPNFVEGTDTDREAFEELTPLDVAAFLGEMALGEVGKRIFGQESNTCHRSIAGSYGEILGVDADLDLGPYANVTCANAVALDISEAGSDQSEVLSDFTEVVTLTMGSTDGGYDLISDACALWLVECAEELSSGVANGAVQKFLDEMTGIDAAAAAETYAWITDGVDIVKKGAKKCVTSKFACVKAGLDLANHLLDPPDPERTPRIGNAWGPELEQRLTDAFTAVLEEAPNATIYVGTYPRVFDGSPLVSMCQAAAVGPYLTSLQQEAINLQVDMINAGVWNAAASANAAVGGDRLQVIDIEDHFAGAHLCEGGEVNTEGSGLNALGTEFTKWLSSYDSLAFSLKPNATGHRIYATAMADAIQDTRRTTVMSTSAADSTTLPVQGGTASLDIRAAGGSAFQIQATSPGGITQTASADAFSGVVSLSVPNPEAGNWTIATVPTASMFRMAVPTATTSLTRVTIATPTRALALATAAGEVTETAVAGTFRFNAGASTGAAQYSWAFSDGTTGAGAVIEHAFGAGADVAATLTVTSVDGLVSHADVRLVAEIIPVRAIGEAVLSGGSAVGETLEVTAPAWYPSPDALSYAWLRDGEVIPGETGATYELTGEDLGAPIVARVTASAAGYVATTVETAAVQVTDRELTVTVDSPAMLTSGADLTVDVSAMLDGDAAAGARATLVTATGAPVAEAVLDGAGEGSVGPVTVTAGARTFTVRVVADGVQAESAPFTVVVGDEATAVAITLGADILEHGGTVEIPVSVVGEGVVAGDAVTLDVDGVEAATRAIAEEDLTESGAAVVVMLDTSSLDPGDHTLVARYAGGAGTASSSREVAVSILVPTSLEVDPSDAIAGNATAVDVTVTASPVAGAALGGTVTLTLEGGHHVAAEVVDGVAALVVPAASAGTVSGMLAFAATGPYAPSTAPFTLDVRAASSTTSLALDRGDAVYGEPVTATIGVSVETGAIPHGTVEIRAGEAVVGQAAMDGEVTDVALDGLDVGTHGLVAVFVPADGDTTGSSSPEVELAITPAASTLTIEPVRDPIAVGDTLRAFVSATALDTSVTGTVVAEVDGAPASVEQVDGGWEVTFPTEGLTAGTVTVSVGFTPSSANLAAAAAEVAVVVEESGAGLAVELPRDRIGIDDASPTLEVGLRYGAARSVDVAWPGGGTTLVLDQDGRGETSLPALPVGVHTVTVTFAGEGDLGAAERAVELSVESVVGAVEAPDAAFTYALEAPALEVSFIGVPSGAAPPEGDVVARVDGVQVGSATLVEGAAHVALEGLTVGTHTVEVEFAGDSRFAGSSTSATVTVAPAPVVLDVMWPDTQTAGAIGGVVEVTATVDGEAVDPDLAAVRGEAVLVIDGEEVARAALTEGAGALALPAGLVGGVHRLSVAVLGAPEYQDASTEETVRVARATSTVVIDAPRAVAAEANLRIPVAVVAEGFVPAGRVVASIDGTVVNASLTGGTGTLRIDGGTLSPGRHRMVVSYAGSDTVAGSQMAVWIEVRP